MEKINEGDVHEETNGNGTENGKHEEENGVPVDEGERFDPLKKLKASQMQALEEMRKKADEYAVDEAERKWCNDMCLLRYLRARDYNVSKSEKVLVFYPIFLVIIAYCLSFDTLLCIHMILLHCSTVFMFVCINSLL